MSKLVMATLGAPESTERGGPSRAKGVGLSAVAGMLCVVVNVTASGLFLPHQALWFDEAVQLGGLTLGPIEVVRWLAGRVYHPACLAWDRMPPLSYWAGLTWSQAFGGGEVSLRWMGVTAVAVATLLVFLAANRAWGLGPGLAAGLLFGLSPNVVAHAVEIRAYPLFLLASSATLYCLTRLLSDPIPERIAWLVATAVCGIVATYTHFFGLVLAGGTLLAALILVPMRGGRIGPVVMACAAVGLASLGLFPFVTAAVGISSNVRPSLTHNLVDLFRLGYRLVSSPAMSVSMIAVALSLLAGVTATLSALAPKRRSGAAATGILITLASGAAVVALVKFATTKLDAANPSYNDWMLPTLSLLMASGLASASQGARRASLAGVMVLLACDTYADGQLAVNGDFFAHTPVRAVVDPIKRYGGTERVAVLHDGDGTLAWQIYTPLFHDFGPDLRNYVNAPGATGPLRVFDYPEQKTTVDPLTLPVEYLVVVSTTVQGAKEIAAQIHGGIRPPIDGPLAKALMADPRWSLVSNTTHASLFLIDLAVFKRVNDDGRR